MLAKLVVEDRKAKGVGDVDAVVRPLSGVTSTFRFSLCC